MIAVVAVYTAFGSLPPTCLGPMTATGSVQLLDGKSLYPGRIYRGFIEEKYILNSYDDLLNRLAALPAGTTIFYSEPSEPPSERFLGHGRFIRLSWFCQTHKIRLIDVNTVRYLERVGLCR